MDDAAPTTLAERARRLRHRSGLSFLNIERAMWKRELDDLGPHSKSYGAAARIEYGETPEDDADVVYLAILANIYDVPLEELSPLAARRARKIRELLADRGCNLRGSRDTADQRPVTGRPGRAVA